MTEGKGLAAVQERIRKSFLEVHKDRRNREQREADEEMLASIQTESAPTLVAETEVQLSVEESIQKQSATEKRANAYITVALRSTHVVKHTTHRSNIHRAWLVEAPTETANDLFDQALRDLGLEGK